MLDPAPEIRFFAAADGYRLATRVWNVPQPRAHVVLLHGMVSHGGWYLSSGSHLARKGFAVHLLDRRGSGLNPQARGDVDRWETWLDDVKRYLDALPTGAPRVLLGISWGGTLATAVVRRWPDAAAGLGLICPGLFSRKGATGTQRFALRLAELAHLRAPRVTIPLRDPVLFTNAPDDQSYIARDPLTLRTMTLGFAVANQKLVEYATERPEEIRVPTLLMLAEKDPISDNRKLREFAGRSGNARYTVIEYPGASHTLEFEPDPSQYFHDLAAWCRHAVA
ncbi:MAG: alpha/beta fold hydrolase [Pirellulales bacterium]